MAGIVALFCAPAWAEWPPAELTDDLGIGSSTAATLEVRVWLGGGITEPQDLYRFVESNGVVTVEHIKWARTTQPEEGLMTEKEARKETSKTRGLMKKHYCGDQLKESGEFLWCRVPPRSKDVWPVVMRDLLPDELWSLPETVDRDCGWDKADGEMVGIHILTATRSHRVVYPNPDFCCRHMACAIANHVRQVVRENLE